MAHEINVFSTFFQLNASTVPIQLCTIQDLFGFINGQKMNFLLAKEIHEKKLATFNFGWSNWFFKKDHFNCKKNKSNFSPYRFPNSFSCIILKNFSKLHRLIPFIDFKSDTFC